MDNEREQVTRILGLPPERIEYLHSEHQMPFSDAEFTAWFVANAALVLEELRMNHDRLLFPGELRPEPTETAP